MDSHSSSSAAMDALVYHAQQQHQQMQQMQQHSTPVSYETQQARQFPDSSCMMDLFLASPSGDMDGDKPAMAKRRRRLNAPETQLLMDVFLVNQKPNAQLRTELGEKLGMTPRAVQIWFQNKRAKLKKDPNSPIVGKAPLQGGTIGSSANLSGYEHVYGNMKPQQMYYQYPQQGGRFPPNFSPFPTPPAHTMATLVSPRNPPTLDLAPSSSSVPSNWISPHSQTPGNRSTAPSSSSSCYPQSMLPFDTQAAARRSANAFSSYQARRSAPLSVVGGVLAVSSPAQGVSVPTTAQLYNALQNIPTGPGWSLPVGPLSFIGSRNEVMKNRPILPNSNPYILNQSTVTSSETTFSTNDKSASPSNSKEDSNLESSSPDPSVSEPAQPKPLKSLHTLLTETSLPSGPGPSSFPNEMVCENASLRPPTPLRPFERFPAAFDSNGRNRTLPVPERSPETMYANHVYFSSLAKKHVNAGDSPSEEADVKTENGDDSSDSKKPKADETATSDCSFLFNDTDRPGSAQPTEPSNVQPPRYTTPDFFAMSRSPSQSAKSDSSLPFWTDPASALFNFSRESPPARFSSSFGSLSGGVPLERLVTPPPLHPPQTSSAVSSVSSHFRMSETFFDGFLKGEQSPSDAKLVRLVKTEPEEKSHVDETALAE